MADFPTRRQVLGGMAGGALTLAGVSTLGASYSSASPGSAPYQAPDPRDRVNLNAGWRFVRRDVSGAESPGFDDSWWESVDTPHTWNAVDGADGGADYYRGVGWYRQRYTVPPDMADKILYVQFDGANQVTDVWVNGRHVGQHRGGYARFRFNLTDVLVPGEENVFAVRVNNAYDDGIAPRSGDFTMQGGIYRDVSLWAVDALHVRMEDYGGPGVYLRSSDVTEASAAVTVTTRVWNDGSAARSVVVRSVITDDSGTVAAEASSSPQWLAADAGVDVEQTLAVDSPRLWNGLADPYLYQATVEVHDVTGDADTVTDVVTERLGIRTVAVDADTGFYLNGSHVGLHGVNLHQDWDVKGWAITEADRRRDFDMIRELGANTVRLAHYQHAQHAYDLADERGLVVWAEIPLVNSVTDAYRFTANTKRQLHELIRQNYNHPSIAFWGIGNEVGPEYGGPENRLLASLADIIASQDPDRLSTYALRGDDPDDAPTGLHTDVSGFNRYYGWYFGSKDDDLGAWADNLHANSPSRRFSVSEYGTGAGTSQHELNPPRPDPDGDWHPEEYQSLWHEAAWRQLASRPFIWGAFVWAMFDFASDYRAEGEQHGINDKGLVTRDRRIRKDAFYWYKANWATTPTLYITSRRWTKRTDAVTELKVYSNAEEVTATLNGEPLGAVSSDDHIFRWTDITLRSGTNTVEVTATINGSTHTDSVEWTLGDGPETGVHYRLVAQHSDKLADINGASTSPGATLIQWPANGGLNQQFDFLSSGDGYYRIRSRNSGLVLQVANTSSGADITQQRDSNAASQQWRVVDQGGGAVSLINRASGLAMDVWEASTADGARISQWTPTGNPNQRFGLQRA